MKKILIGIMALLFLATPALAGNQPEYDAVGCDASNFFNDFIKVAVCVSGLFDIGPTSIRLNEYSYFPYDPTTGYGEYFSTTAGRLLPDPCFDEICIEKPYLSALTDPWNEGIYRWQIVLQKKPESDIDVVIRDCVTKHNTFNVWTEAEQTGRYRAPWGQLFFIPSANPSVTVVAHPGPFATPSFITPFTMDARIMPGLDAVPMDDALYTSKALWAESLVMVLPETGLVNTLGQSVYNLHQGDYLFIEIRIPPNNTVDLRYGPDNVVLEYIGIVGTEYWSDVFCGVCDGGCDQI